MGVLFAKEQCGLLRGFMLGGDLCIPVLPVQFVYPSPLATDLLSVPRFLPFGYTSSLLYRESHPAQKRKETETAICPSQVEICKEDFTSLLRFKLKKFSYQIRLS
jgi:hypothetical protein